jgi:hypothetical protein
MPQTFINKDIDHLFCVYCQFNEYAEKDLTIGFSYNVYEEIDNKYLIKNDNNILKTYYKSRFKKL